MTAAEGGSTCSSGIISARDGTRSPWLSSSGGRPADHRPAALRAARGSPRLAWAAPPGAPGVLIVPGLSSRKENHADFGAALAAAGMGALALDCGATAAARDRSTRA